MIRRNCLTFRFSGSQLLKQKIAKQQTAQGEVADPIGVSPKEMKSLRKSFNKFDADGSGTIETKELKTVSQHALSY